MPSVDAARRRVRLSDAHISVLGILVEEGETPAELSRAQDELREAGLLDAEDKIVADLYPLVSTLMEPRVIARVEVTGPQGVTNNGAVMGNEFIFVHEAWPGEAESQYVPAEPETLVWSLVRMVDLHRDLTDEADTGEVIEATMGLLDQVIERMEGGESQEPEAVAEATGAPVRLAEVLAELNCMWRMTVVWQGDGPARTDSGLAVSALAVWDCGVEGYWVRELPAEPVADGQVDAASELRVRRVSAKELWQRVTDLLPDGAQLASSAA
ncbi:hypothetical protein [Streptomyces lancefieldiae]|uniref:Uncharacterized protein n=1 Tax=Streptomyces lancefieldiae TaxID=3075520 RepID=A0ABU3ATS0_9ACTN|nr:hypothetical protein [Streptomyces sp. DSM 40712]MDT0613579.1 hypothetical protein [Streptomyces sp. DSM 40712]